MENEKRPSIETTKNGNDVKRYDSTLHALSQYKEQLNSILHFLKNTNLFYPLEELKSLYHTFFKLLRELLASEPKKKDMPTYKHRLTHLFQESTRILRFDLEYPPYASIILYDLLTLTDFYVHTPNSALIKRQHVVTGLTTILELIAKVRPHAHNDWRYVYEELNSKPQTQLFPLLTPYYAEIFTIFRKYHDTPLKLLKLALSIALPGVNVPLTIGKKRRGALDLVSHGEKIPFTFAPRLDFSLFNWKVYIVRGKCHNFSQLLALFPYTNLFLRSAYALSPPALHFSSLRSSFTHLATEHPTSGISASLSSHISFFSPSQLTAEQQILTSAPQLTPFIQLHVLGPHDELPLLIRRLHQAGVTQLEIFQQHYVYYSMRPPQFFLTVPLREQLARTKELLHFLETGQLSQANFEQFLAAMEDHHLDTEYTSIYPQVTDDSVPLPASSDISLRFQPRVYRFPFTEHSYAEKSAKPRRLLATIHDAFLNSRRAQEHLAMMLKERSYQRIHKNLYTKGFIVYDIAYIAAVSSAWQVSAPFFVDDPLMIRYWLHFHPGLSLFVSTLQPVYLADTTVDVGSTTADIAYMFYLRMPRFLEPVALKNTRLAHSFQQLNLLKRESLVKFLDLRDN